MKTLFKWTHCFVAWKDDEGNMRFTSIPWYLLIYIKLFGYNQQDITWIPPWKVFINERAH